MQQVRHRVDEDETRPDPPDRLIQRGRVNSEPEAWAGRTRVAIDLVLRRSHELQAASHRQGVAVIAPSRDPITSGRRIPGCLGPANGSLVSHYSASKLRCRAHSPMTAAVSESIPPEVSGTLGGMPTGWPFTSPWVHSRGDAQLVLHDRPVSASSRV